MLRPLLLPRALLRHLSVRIALLMTLSALLIVFAFTNAQYLSVRLFGDAPWQDLVWIPLALVTTPLLVGYLVARYVTRPLHAFVSAIDSLQQSDYRAALRPVGIQCERRHTVT